MRVIASLGAVLSPTFRATLQEQVNAQFERLNSARQAIALARDSGLSADEVAGAETLLDEAQDLLLALGDAAGGDPAAFDSQAAAQSALTQATNNIATVLGAVPARIRDAALARPWNYLLWGGLAVVLAGVGTYWALNKAAVYRRRKFRGYRMVK